MGKSNFYSIINYNNKKNRVKNKPIDKMERCDICGKNKRIIKYKIGYKSKLEEADRSRRDILCLFPLIVHAVLPRPNVVFKWG